LKVYPVAGYVDFNWRRSSLGSAVGHFQEKSIPLTQADQEKLVTAQLIANRRGFVVALVCPHDGSVVETFRGSDLPDGVLARCPMQDCGKEWINAD
jgi:hypothetical protein